jgi:P2-related tail formation protein
MNHSSVQIDDHEPKAAPILTFALEVAQIAQGVRNGVVLELRKSLLSRRCRRHGKEQDHHTALQAANGPLPVRSG